MLYHFLFLLVCVMSDLLVNGEEGAPPAKMARVEKEELTKRDGNYLHIMVAKRASEDNGNPEPGVFANLALDHLKKTFPEKKQVVEEWVLRTKAFQLNEVDVLMCALVRVGLGDEQILTFVKSFAKNCVQFEELRTYVARFWARFHVLQPVDFWHYRKLGSLTLDLEVEVPSPLESEVKFLPVFAMSLFFGLFHTCPDSKEWVALAETVDLLARKREGAITDEAMVEELSKYIKDKTKITNIEPDELVDQIMQCKEWESKWSDVVVKLKVQGGL